MKTKQNKASPEGNIRENIGDFRSGNEVLGERQKAQSMKKRINKFHFTKIKSSSTWKIIKLVLIQTRLL